MKILWHFIKSDFLSHKIFWVIVFFIGVFSLLHEFDEIQLFGAYILLLAGMLPMSWVIGSSWRSRQVLSRYYIMCLPIDWRVMFMILQVRCLVFFAPGLLGCTLAVIRFGDVFDTNSKLWLLAPLTWLLFFIILTNILVWMVLTMDKINARLTRVRRLACFIFVFLVMGAVVSVLVTTLEEIFCFGDQLAYYFLILVILALLQVCLSYREWRRRA